MKFKSRVNQNQLKYIPVSQPEPSEFQRILFWSLNVIDIAVTYKGLKHPSIHEANFLLGPDPALSELILQKALIGPIVDTRFSARQMTLTNSMLILAIIHNLTVINKIDSF